MSENSSTQPTNKRRAFKAIAAVATLGFLGKAVAQGMPGRGDPAAMAERRVDHLIKLVNGTPEQKTKLLALAQAAMTDMKPLREQLSGARKRGMELLAAASIDRSAVDKLRGEQVQLMDGISRRMSAHMMDAAEVLTPAQRVIVADKMKQRGEGGGHRGYGGHGGWFR
ncbi:MAG: periplasmic heavy metal sensor [Burkholderiales bacterium]|nr:MAG: periplasmic heavy metal sensor [Burkholderiales bacterium]